MNNIYTLSIKCADMPTAPGPLPNKPVLDDREFQEIQRLCNDRTNRAGILKALIVPIRTNSLEKLAKDLFLPAVCAVKVGSVGFRIFLSLLLLPLDLLTLPIRLVTVIPRIIYNARVSPVQHPFCHYLESTSRELEGEIEVRLEHGYETSRMNLAIKTVHTWVLNLSTREVPSFWSGHIVEEEQPGFPTDEGHPLVQTQEQSLVLW